MNSCFLTETDRYIFGQGNHYEIYNKLGAHLTTVDGREGVHFAVWAPNAVDAWALGIPSDGFEFRFLYFNCLNIEIVIRTIYFWHQLFQHAIVVLFTL